MLAFALSASLIFIFTLFVYYDTRTPIDTSLLYKYRVKEKSVFRKIIPFKDKPHYPCCYFKAAPVYVYLCITLLGWLLLAIDMFVKGCVTKFITNDILLIMTMAMYCVYFLYFISITIWWGIVDHKLMRFTKEEKAELKRLRKSRKKQAKNQS